MKKRDFEVLSLSLSLSLSNNIQETALMMFYFRVSYREVTYA